ncbi:glycoside hydrolase family 2 [Cryptococcus neoformans var. grubii Br795]|nr:glycoside hydrolase family 2 [Cryptococcus neoformans var. grubii MW-RSA36]OXG81254.1 glycoside hydrolase family 2 [Cryptococcus neoformans var. grubii Br795]OXL08029.1 glycoside hydrolase family 2 [Cryptococcus neoformans var. grubii Gb118]
MSVNPLTYPSSHRPFSLDIFKSPPSEYRGAPFWGWVTKQEKQSTVGQIEMLEEMGMGGFHMHTRVGLDIPYLGEEFMSIVEGCVDEAKKRGMSAFLYDEDRWPSGFAGGKVLEGHPEFRHLHLLFTPWAYGSELGYTKPDFPIANAAPMRSELGTLLATYAIKLQDGFLQSSRIISSSSDLETSEVVWYAYAEPLPDSGFFGDQTYTDLLSKEMTSRFIEITHEVYKEHVGSSFGSVVPSIFTDEPQYCPMSTLNAAEKLQDIFLPWTRGIIYSFKASKGGDLLELLPRLVWDPADGQPNTTRSQFLDHVCELFSTNYIGTIAKWCAKNNIMCIGHMNAEPTLASQTAQNGEVMRCYREMQFPGIDMLCDKHELNTAKQAASVARQYGRPGVMSELYGVTGWQFTFEGHKGQGDWQAALGVTLRVHHLFWSTMEGEAKRDYPACIGYQSPWWKEYKTIEDHFARVNYALTRGRPVTRVAVIHPIESYWLCFGPKDKNTEELDYREQAFAQLTEWLLGSHIDFDFISESLFPELTSLDDINSTLPVGECKYDVVIAPNLHTIRSTTLERLDRFAKKGGKVIFAGSSPTLVDTVTPFSPPSIPTAITLPWSRAQILSALQPFRDVDMIINESTLYRTQGKRADTLFYQMREEGEERWVFVCNTDRKESTPVEVGFKGEWKIELLDTMKGDADAWVIQSDQRDGWTYLKYWFDGCESVLLHLVQGSSKNGKPQTVLRRQYKQVADVKLQSISLSEPNALLLDYCTYKWDDEPWSSSSEEILAIDQLLRRRFGLFLKGAKFRQPYTISPSSRKPIGKLRLRFAFTSACEVQGAHLAIESADKVKMWLDGQEAKMKVDGWWVDKSIKTIPLPYITKGIHMIELEYDYGMLTNLERIYILGSFGVDVRGRTTSIVPLDLSTVEWGDITRQNLPFYTGNITYHCTFTSLCNAPQAIRVARYAGPAVSVDVDGSRAALLVHEPYAFELGTLPKGEHTIDFTCYGDRHNAFGAVHLVPNKTNWLNADTWRSDYDWWSEEYVLGEIGILNAPRIEEPGLEVPKQVRRGLMLHV